MTTRIRAAATVAIATLSACSSSGAATTTAPARPNLAGNAPASASSTTRATFTIHWGASTAQSVKHRATISASTQSVSVTVNGGVATVVNKPTVSGSPTATSVSIPAPAGSDAFTFTAWDEVGGNGNALDQATTTQDIIADANNAVSVTLDGVCAALVPSLSTPSVFAETTSVTTPLTSGSRTVLQAARLVGNITQSFAFTPVDADGNTILTSAGTVPISVTESGSIPHVTIAANASGTANTIFKVTPLVAEPDGFSTQLTASSPNCGSGTPTLPNSFALSTSAEVVVGDYSVGVIAFDQDGTLLETLLQPTSQPVTGLAYNSKSNYLVAVEPNSTNSAAVFQTLTPAGATLGSGTITPTSSPENFPRNLAYNPTNGLFAAAFITNASGNPASIVNLAISGSTATVESSKFSGLTDPISVVTLANGNVVVADNAGSGKYAVDIFDAAGDLDDSISQYAYALTVDTLRGNIISQDIDGSNANTYYGGIITTSGYDIALADEFGEPLGTPQYPYSALAYNQGEDELYMLGYGKVQSGLSGTTFNSGGSAYSNLAPAAFSPLVAPQQAVVIP